MNEHLIIILKKMCECIKADYYQIDFEDGEWYYTQKWTIKQEDDFKIWLAEFIFNNKDARIQLTTIHHKTKRICKQFANEFIWNYGWNIK